MQLQHRQRLMVWLFGLQVQNLNRRERGVRNSNDLSWNLCDFKQFVSGDRTHNVSEFEYCCDIFCVRSGNLSLQKGDITKFVPLLFCCRCWSGDPGWKKNQDLGYKHPGSATLMIGSISNPGNQCFGSGSRIRDPVSFWHLYPRWLTNQDPDPGS